MTLFGGNCRIEYQDEYTWDDDEVLTKVRTKITK